MGYEPTTTEGEQTAREAVELAERLDDATTLSAAIDASSAMLQGAGRYRELSNVERRRIELVERLTDAIEIGDTFAMAAWTATYIGQYAEGRDYARRGRVARNRSTTSRRRSASERSPRSSRQSAPAA